jgi:hypothetical protein
MNGKMAAGVLMAFTAASASTGFAQRERSAGGRSSGGARVGHHGGGHAVPRGSVGPGAPTGARHRHPRAGYGTGYYHGHGYGRYPYYGHYPYFGYYPYYGRYPYPYGLGLGFGFYQGGAYPYYGGYGAPAAPYYYGAPAVGMAYYGGAAPAGYANEADRGDAAELQLVVVPDDASVWVDDQFLGVARDLARVPLPPGRHRIEVVRPGFRPAAQEVDLSPGTSTSLRIELERP